MLDKETGRKRVRLAAATVMSNRGWNIQDVIDRSGLDRKTVSSFLNGDRWPQPAKRSKLETAFGWEPGTIARVLEGETPSGPEFAAGSDVGGHPQDPGYVAAPGDHADPSVTDNEVLREVRAMREDLNALSRRVARLESDPEPLGGADGPV